MFGYDGHVTELAAANDYNARLNTNNLRQFSVTSLLRLGHKRRNSDESNEGKLNFLMRSFCFYINTNMSAVRQNKLIERKKLSLDKNIL
jgi:hypothetical protein